MRRPKPLAVQVMERSETRGTARLVLLGYAWFGDPDGSSITASAPEIAKKAGVSVRTVERYRPQLIKLGELVVVARDGHGEHAEYGITLPGPNPRSGDSEHRQNRQQRRQAANPGINARERDPDPENPGEDGKPSSRRPGLGIEDSRPDVDRLCEVLAALIGENGRPAHLIAWPSDAWRREARLLLDSDGRDPAEAERLVRWCQADHFWRGNVLGMRKFRERYDTLRLQAARDGRHLATVPTSNGRMSKADRVDAEVAELLSEARNDRT